MVITTKQNNTLEVSSVYSRGRASHRYWLNSYRQSAAISKHTSNICMWRLVCCHRWGHLKYVWGKNLLVPFNEGKGLTVNKAITTNQVVTLTCVYCRSPQFYPVSKFLQGWASPSMTILVEVQAAGTSRWQRQSYLKQEITP